MGEKAGESDNGEGITAALANRQESRTESNRRLNSRLWRCIGWVVSLNSLTCPKGFSMNEVKDRKDCSRPLEFLVRGLSKILRISRCCARIPHIERPGIGAYSLHNSARCGYNIRY